MPNSTDHPLTDAFLNAYTFAFGEKRGFTHGSAWRFSLDELVRTTHCNTIILPVCAWQDHAYSVTMDSDCADVMDEEDVRAVCTRARELGLFVILKAMVNCRDGYWRAYIHFFDEYVPTEPSWPDWFASWEKHVLRVADMARENHADLYCIGCEMVGTDRRSSEWRSLIEKVRRHFDGPLTYNCDKYQEDRVTWWDALDVISSSGYYPMDQLDENFERIRAVAETYQRPFLFMECGCPSRNLSPMRPNDWRFGEGVSGQAQAEWYDAFTHAIFRYPFIRGTGWWDWSATRLYPEAFGADNNGYCTYGKPASGILLRFAERLRDRQ